VVSRPLMVLSSVNGGKLGTIVRLVLVLYRDDAARQPMRESKSVVLSPSGTIVSTRGNACFHGVER
jgi:hypothetical protein